MNRSPSAYLNNPASERSKYKYDVDNEMTLIKFVDKYWGPIGTFNWFATHGTSMSRTNSLISGDNKGAAARFMEDWFERSSSGRSLHVNESGTSRIPRRVSSLILNSNENSTNKNPLSPKPTDARRHRCYIHMFASIHKFCQLFNNDTFFLYRK